MPRRKKEKTEYNGPFRNGVKDYFRELEGQNKLNMPPIFAENFIYAYREVNQRNPPEEYLSGKFNRAVLNKVESEYGEEGKKNLNDKTGWTHFGNEQGEESCRKLVEMFEKVEEEFKLTMFEHIRKEKNEKFKNKYKNIKDEGTDMTKAYKKINYHEELSSWSDFDLSEVDLGKCVDVQAFNNLIQMHIGKEICLAATKEALRSKLVKVQEEFKKKYVALQLDALWNSMTKKFIAYIEGTGTFDGAIALKDCLDVLKPLLATEYGRFKSDAFRKTDGGKYEFIRDEKEGYNRLANHFAPNGSFEHLTDCSPEDFLLGLRGETRSQNGWSFERADTNKLKDLIVNNLQVLGEKAQTWAVGRLNDIRNMCSHRPSLGATDHHRKITFYYYAKMLEKLRGEDMLTREQVNGYLCQLVQVQEQRVGFDLVDRGELDEVFDPLIAEVTWKVDYYVKLQKCIVGNFGHLRGLPMPHESIDYLKELRQTYRDKNNGRTNSGDDNGNSVGNYLLLLSKILSHDIKGSFKRIKGEIKFYKKLYDIPYENERVAAIGAGRQQPDGQQAAQLEGGQADGQQADGQQATQQEGGQAAQPDGQQADGQQAAQLEGGQAAQPDGGQAAQLEGGQAAQLEGGQAVQQDGGQAGTSNEENSGVNTIEDSKDSNDSYKDKMGVDYLIDNNLRREWDLYSKYYPEYLKKKRICKELYKIDEKLTALSDKLKEAQQLKTFSCSETANDSTKSTDNKYKFACE